MQAQRQRQRQQRLQQPRPRATRPRQRRLRLQLLKPRPRESMLRQRRLHCPPPRRLPRARKLRQLPPLPQRPLLVLMDAACKVIHESLEATSPCHEYRSCHHACLSQLQAMIVIIQLLCKNSMQRALTTCFVVVFMMQKCDSILHAFQSTSVTKSYCF